MIVALDIFVFGNGHSDCNNENQRELMAANDFT